MVKDLPSLPGGLARSYRLVNSKYPPIGIFDDVANADEFEALFALQALSNPRLRNEAGDIELIPRRDIPFGIPGCSYAVAPFTHINPNGSRFSDGRHGVLYLADTIDTALAEVRYHQALYWGNVPDMRYDRFVFRGLSCQFDECGMADGTALPAHDPIYSPSDYSAARRMGLALKESGTPGIRYRSVRSPGATCWALMTPRPVRSIVQVSHYEMIWRGGITEVNRLVSP